MVRILVQADAHINMNAQRAMWVADNNNGTNEHLLVYKINSIRFS